MAEIKTPLDLYKVLFEPFPDSVKETKRMGRKGVITFVEWYHYISRAWKQFPKGFTKEISKLASAGEYLLCVVRITDVNTGIFMESTGSAPVSKSSDNFGGAAAESEHQATKRAFAHFGLGLEMYMDEEDQGQADPDAGPEKPMTKEQIDRMKQLVGAVPEDNEELNEFVATLRANVKGARDKEFHASLAADMLEQELVKAGIDVPDPS